jgi:hypothetical protein
MGEVDDEIRQDRKGNGGTNGDKGDLKRKDYEKARSYTGSWCICGVGCS